MTAFYTNTTKPLLPKQFHQSSWRDRNKMRHLVAKLYILKSNDAAYIWYCAKIFFFDFTRQVNNLLEILIGFRKRLPLCVAGAKRRHCAYIHTVFILFNEYRQSCETGLVAFLNTRFFHCHIISNSDKKDKDTNQKRPCGRFCENYFQVIYRVCFICSRILSRKRAALSCPPRPKERPKASESATTSPVKSVWKYCVPMPSWLN